MSRASQPGQPATLYDGDTFTHKGYTFRVRFPRDEDMGPPWKEHDGHGPVSEWTRRDKRPGERVLVEDRGSRRLYDIAGALELARKDGWGCRHTITKPDHTWESGHRTKGEAAACAVEQDYQYLRAWCRDEWCWMAVDVETEDGSERESLGGVAGSDDKYLTKVAYELADEIIGRLEVETPDAVVSEN